MKSGSIKLKVIAGCVALALNTGAQALVVDLFSTPQGPYTDITPTQGDTGTVITAGEGGSVNGLDILGGNRDLFVSLLDNNVNNLGGDLVPPTTLRSGTIGVANGVLDFITSTNTAARGQIQWDGATNTDATINTTGLGGVVFGNTGNFQLDIVFSDAGFRFDITIYTDDTHWTQVSLLSNEHLVPTTTFIPLSAFNNPSFCSMAFPDPGFPGVLDVNCGSGGVADLNNVGALVVDLNPLGGSTAIDLTLDAVNVVPEPGSVALLGAGLLGLFGVGRRFKKLA